MFSKDTYIMWKNMVHIKTCNLWKTMTLTDLDFPMGPTEQLPFHLSYLRMKTNPLSETMCYFLQHWRVDHVQNPGIPKLWLKFLQQWYERRNLNLKTMKCKPKFLDWFNTTLLSLSYLPLFLWTYITLGPAPPTLLEPLLKRPVSWCCLAPSVIHLKSTR